MTEAELNRAISFPDWAHVLEADTTLEASERAARRSGIVAYLSFLKRGRLRASLASAKAFIDETERSGAATESLREALRWFFRTAQSHARDGISQATVEPSPGREVSDAHATGNKQFHVPQCRQCLHSDSRPATSDPMTPV